MHNTKTLRHLIKKRKSKGIKSSEQKMHLFSPNKVPKVYNLQSITIKLKRKLTGSPRITNSHKMQRTRRRNRHRPFKLTNNWKNIYALNLLKACGFSPQYQQIRTSVWLCCDLSHRGREAAAAANTHSWTTPSALALQQKVQRNNKVYRPGE